MKKTNHASVGVGDDNARTDAFNLTAGASPRPAENLSTREVLLRFGALFANAQINGMMGEAAEVYAARGVQAGLVATLHELLPPAQFRSVMIQWEVDAIKLSELLELAGVNAIGEKQPEFTTTIEA